MLTGIDHNKLSESKTATEFRESNLQNIIGLAFNLLNDTYNSDDSTIGNPELRMQLFDHSLTLLLACLSFDCKSSHYDYSNDNLPCMMLPEGWLSSLITESNITLLYSMYVFVRQNNYGKDNTNAYYNDYYYFHFNHHNHS